MLVLSAAVLLFWVALTLDPVRRWPARSVLPQAAPAGDTAPSVVAIVPSRDEAQTLPRTLPTLLVQPSIRRVIVVDDGSRDGTAERAHEVAAELGAAAARQLSVVVAPRRPPGWSGKVHAQAVGFTEASRVEPEAEWLLLTDADICHRAGSVAAMLGKAVDDGHDLVSVMARLRTESFWERLLVPPFVYFFQLLYPFRLVSSERSRVAAAAGGCVLVRRQALVRAGGFEAIRDALIDDVNLGRVVKRAGGRLWLGLDPGIESVRPYPRLHDMWAMVARNAFVQLRFSWLLLAAVLTGISVFFVVPPVGAALATLAALRTDAPEYAAAAGGFLAAWLLQSWHLLPAVAHHRVSRLWAVTLPAASLLYGAMTLSSALAHVRGRSSTWRGRTYGRVEHEPGSRPT